MFEESELITLLIAFGVAWFLLSARKAIISLPSYRFLLLGFVFYLVSKISTVLEGFVWESFFNPLEHISTVLFYALLFWWSLRVRVQKEVDR